MEFQSKTTKTTLDVQPSPLSFAGRPRRLVFSVSCGKKDLVETLNHHMTPEKARELGEKLIEWSA